MIPRYCIKASKCSYGKLHNPCDLHENCPAFKCDTKKSFENLKENGQSPPKEKKRKYRNEKVECDGYIFDSKWERDRYCQLKLLEKAKKISNLELQKSFELIPTQREPDKVGKRGGIVKGKVIENSVKYVADFVYTDENGKLVVEDCKSKITKTPVYKIKKKLMLQRYGIIIKEVEK